MNARPILLTIAVVFGSLTGIAQDHSTLLPISTTNPLHVTVNFDGDEWPEFQSALNKDIRKLGDVEITASEPGAAVTVVVCELKGESGTWGYAVSTLAVQSADPTPSMIALFGTRLKFLGADGYLNVRDVLSGYSNAVTIKLQLVQYAPASRAEDAASKCAAKLDVEVFEPIRRARVELIEILQRAAKDTNDAPIATRTNTGFTPNPRDATATNAPDDLTQKQK